MKTATNDDLYETCAHKCQINARTASSRHRRELPTFPYCYDGRRTATPIGKHPTYEEEEPDNENENNIIEATTPAGEIEWLN
jgi:hypothetical protein